MPLVKKLHSNYDVLIKSLLREILFRLHDNLIDISCNYFMI
jgi:hypothetical protein